MCSATRREVLIGGGTFAASTFACAGARAGNARFAAEAERMRREAVAAGDQSFGAVIVRNGAIIGYGPSRVVQDRNLDAHAERVALWDAQRRTGSRSLPGAIIVSTSTPCAACQNALAEAGIEAMLVGPQASPSGQPRRW